METLLNEMLEMTKDMTPEEQAELVNILGCVDEYAKMRNNEIDARYDHIKGQATEGNKDAQTVMNWGNKQEIKSAINDSMNKEKATA